MKKISQKLNLLSLLLIIIFVSIGSPVKVLSQTNQDNLPDFNSTTIIDLANYSVDFEFVNPPRVPYFVIAVFGYNNTFNAVIIIRVGQNVTTIDYGFASNIFTVPLTFVHENSIDAYDKTGPYFHITFSEYSVYGIIPDTVCILSLQSGASIDQFEVDFNNNLNNVYYQYIMDNSFPYITTMQALLSNSTTNPTSKNASSSLAIPFLPIIFIVSFSVYTLRRKKNKW